MPVPDYGFNPAGRLLDFMWSVDRHITSTETELRKLSRADAGIEPRRRMNELRGLTTRSLLMDILRAKDDVGLLRRLALVVSLPDAIVETVDVYVPPANAQELLKELPAVRSHLMDFVSNLGAPVLKQPRPFQGLESAVQDLKYCNVLCQSHSGDSANVELISRFHAQVLRLKRDLDDCDLLPGTRTLLAEILNDLLEALDSAFIAGASSVEFALNAALGALTRRPDAVADLKRVNRWDPIRKLIVDLAVVVAGVAAGFQLAPFPDNPRPVIMIQEDRLELNPAQPAGDDLAPASPESNKLKPASSSEVIGDEDPPLQGGRGS